MKNFIEGYVNALTSEECAKIISFMNEDGRLGPGRVKEPNTGKDIVMKEYKDSSDVRMDMREDNEINKIILPSIKKCISLYTKKHPQMNNIDYWELDYIYNLQKYNPGQCFASSHCENTSIETSYRVLAWMYYLNTVKDGGGTQFDNYEIAVEAVEGRCLIWPAYWTHFHHGIVSKTETKYIATGWFLYSSFFVDNE